MGTPGLLLIPGALSEIPDEKPRPSRSCEASMAAVEPPPSACPWS